MTAKDYIRWIRSNIGMIPGISDKNACVMTTDDIRKCLAQYQEEHGVNKAIQKLLFPSFSRSIMI